MLSWNHRHSRYLTGCAGFVFAIWYLSLVIAPLTAQTADAPDTPTPPGDTASPPIPPLPAAPATPTPPQTSAATVISDSSVPATSGVLSSAAGPTPVAGPGAAPESDLGNQITSAAINKKLPFRVTATIGEIYDNNIFSEPKKESDFITRLSAKGEVRVGDLDATDGNYFDMFYIPSLHVYARHSHETGVDQNVDVFYGHHWSKLTLTVEQIYTRDQENDASISGLFTANVYKTLATANYAYSPKLDLVLAGRQEFTSYDEPGFTDTKEWTIDLHALYHLDSKLSVGFGPRFGYLNLTQAPNETYQQFLGRVVYIVNTKLNLQGAAGAEYRQYQTDERSSTLEPIFAFAALYQPDPSVIITLNANRQFRPSYNFLGQDYIATNFYVTTAKRFFDSYHVGVAAGYENDDYRLVSSLESGPTREDNYFFVEPSLTWEASGWLKVAAFDRYEKDSSNFDAFTYDTNQVGVSISATY